MRCAFPGSPSGSPPRRPRSCRGCAGSTSPSRPGVAETIDWRTRSTALGREELDAEVVEQTLGSVLKYHEDFEPCATRPSGLLEEARAATA